MDRLERYLEQVCRSLGGPRAMREHVRQELREHLLDAVERRQAAGLSADDALTQALAEFGQPEELRSELEATHGHRVLASLVDWAMQWKETTMRAKWLWTTWAHLALVAVLAMESLFITFMAMYIVPKYQKLMQDGMIDHAILDAQGVVWMAEYLNGLAVVTRHYTSWMLLGAAVLWGLFEWRVRNENKTLIRLAALGTVAAKLAVVVILTAGSMLVSFCLAMPAMGQMSRPYAVEQVSALDASLSALESAATTQDWKSAQENADAATAALNRLAQGPALTSFTSWNEKPTVDELRTDVKAAQQQLPGVREALIAKDVGRVQSALAAFRQSFAPVREASRKPTRR